MIVHRQEHVVSEVAALGTKAGWAPSRKDLHACGGITLPSGSVGHFPAQQLGH